MKRQLMLVLCLVLCCFFSIGTSVKADDSIIVKVGVYENQPKIFTDQEGNTSGFWHDLIEYIAAEEGWAVEYVHGTWEQGLDRLRKNEIDIMPDVAFTDERSVLYDFSNETVYVSWSGVYSSARNDINTILDLDGKTLAVLKGSVNVDGPEGIKNLLKAFDLECSFIEVDSYIQVFEMVANGNADACVASKDFAEQHLSSYNLSKTSIIFNPASLYFAFPKDSVQAVSLINTIDSYIFELKDDNGSIYYQYLEKWFGQGTATRAVIPAWVLWALAVVGSLVLLFAAGSVILSSQVKIRTRELTREIDRRIQTDIELAKYHEQLEDLVEARTSELKEKTTQLEQANEHLQEMDRLKSVFLASMSHELRTPLNSIIGFTGILLMNMSGELNEEQKKQLNIVKQSANHLLNLINDILDISKIEAGKVELKLEEVNISNLVDETVEQLLPSLEKKGLEFAKEVPDDICIISDKRRIKQVVMNLLSNAIKFTDSGVVKILAGATGQDSINIRVIDSGVGIKPDEHKKLFQPFQQVGASYTKKYEGTGLGLYLSSKLVNLLGGTISVKSQYGEGSDFCLVLPVKSHDGGSPNEENTDN